MAMQRWSMSQNNAALPGKLMKGRLRLSKSDVDLRVASLNLTTASKPINVRKDTLKYEVHVGTTRVPFQKEYNLVLLGQASVGKSGKVKCSFILLEILNKFCYNILLCIYFI